MKIQAIAVNQTGGPEVLRLEERELGDPGPGQVRIRIRAAGVNYIDVYFRTGLYPRPLPFVAGLEGSGEIESVGADVTTVEGLAPGPDRLHPVQEAFRLEHALQCGFCTPGFLMTVTAFLREHPGPSDEEIRRELAGHLCRCTGYQNIVEAVKLASEKMAAGKS